MKLSHLVVALTLVAPAAAFASPKLAQPAELPSADRIAPWIKDRIGDTARVDVRVCLAADGRVTSVKLLKTSSYDAFDRAAMKDVASWRYEPNALPRCTPTHVEYHAR